jgi:hypothetical protein
MSNENVKINPLPLLLPLAVILKTLKKEIASHKIKFE